MKTHRTRILLDSEQMGRMPILFTNPWELRDDLMTRWDFNPLYYYPKNVIKAGDEVGHTATARYVVPGQNYNVMA